MGASHREQEDVKTAIATDDDERQRLLQRIANMLVALKPRLANGNGQRARLSAARSSARRNLTAMPDSLAAVELSRDLYAYLVDEFYSVPWARRQRSCWVMNLEWWNECRKIGNHPPTPRVAMPPPFHAQETMLELPVFVTEDGGFPRLIAD